MLGHAHRERKSTMKCPNVWKLHDLGDHLMRGDTLCTGHDGKWVRSRPAGYPALRQRFKAARLVFTGKADAVIWEGGQ